MADLLRAGAACISLEPPLGLPMIGFVRRYQTATGYGAPLQATALVLDKGPTRVVLCGVDTVGIQSPEVDALRRRVATATGADPAGVLLNWNHTHCAPPGGRTMINLGGPMEGAADEPDEHILAYVTNLHDKVVSVARLAAERLEPAALAWGLGEANLCVNRRERTPDGRIILGWRPDGMVDQSVTALQARRPDGSAIATVVSYGCHTVTVGPDVLDYSADYPGPMRDALRAWTGGEAIFLQGAAGNVLPLVAFAGHRDAETFGRRLALEALHALADRSAGPRAIVRSPDGSVTPFSLYRYIELPAEPPALAALEEVVEFPLLPLPSRAEIADLRARFEAQVDAARARGAGRAELNTLLYNANWAARTEAQIVAGTAPTAVRGSIHAVRLGEGAIATGPGEIFTEIGMAVKERSPARPTLYAGYTNGAISYFPTAAAYPEGGYEPGYGNRSYGLPSQVSPECEQILIERAVRLVERLFPERPAYKGEGWTASGALPTLPAEPPDYPPVA